MSALNDWVVEARIQYSSLNMAAEKQVLTFNSTSVSSSLLRVLAD